MFCTTLPRRTFPDLPRPKGHRQEWIDACRGQGKTFSDFDVGGKLTEIGLAGVVALRTGKSLDWDGRRWKPPTPPRPPASFTPRAARSG